MTDFIGKGYFDTFRHFEPGEGHYTWWSYRPGVREKNVGWRLDYFMMNDEAKGRLKKSHARAIRSDERKLQRVDWSVIYSQRAEQDPDNLYDAFLVTIDLAAITLDYLLSECQRLQNTII